MGVLDPQTPNNDDPAAPKRGFFVRRINDVKKNAGNLLAPPCLKRGPEAGGIVNTIFMLRVRTPVHVRFSRAEDPSISKKRFQQGNVPNKITKRTGTNLQEKES